MCVYIYIHTYIHTYIHLYIYDIKENIPRPAGRHRRGQPGLPHDRDQRRRGPAEASKDKLVVLVLKGNLRV